MIPAPISLGPLGWCKFAPRTCQPQKGVRRSSPARVSRVGSRHASVLSLQSVELIDADEHYHLRRSPARAVTMRWVWLSAVSFFGSTQDGGSPGSNRPRRQPPSRSVRLRPYESSYFLPSGPSSGQLASMFTDVEALLPALPGRPCWRAEHAKDEETAQSVHCTTCRGAHDDHVAMLTTSGRYRGPDLRPEARTHARASVGANLRGREGVNVRA